MTTARFETGLTGVLRLDRWHRATLMMATHIDPVWWRGADSNRRHMDFQSTALPPELPRRSRTSDIGPVGDAGVEPATSTV